jgi:uncharacterized membrane protein YdbT with pleckstrin-like domain
MLNLDTEEKIILEVRKHWFVFLGKIISFILAVFVPMIVLMLSLIFTPENIKNIIHQYLSLIFFIYSLWLLFSWIILFIQWTNYYLDVWYVTEKRIIDVEQKGVFHREISNLRFDRIQDISIEVKGFIGTILNFGDIQVQTAAEDSSEFNMKNARNPENARKVIFIQHNLESERHRNIKSEK